LRKGRAFAVAGKYDAALGDLKSVDAEKINRKLVKADLQFYLALCQGRLALESGAGKEQAVESMLAFVRSAANSNHFFQAADLLGDLAASQGDFENAVKYYGAISSKAPWPAYRLRALVAEADAMVQQQRFADAQKKYESIGAEKADSPEAKRLKLLAEVGRGRCVAETVSADDGINLLEKLILENDAADTELFGRAYNALGDCLQISEKPKEALMAYLHVDVLFYGNPDTHAEALYHLSKLWQVAKNQDRAAAAENLLKQRYAGRLWAEKP
jgi:tetratricopeptide (TPR) repeat protein